MSHAVLFIENMLEKGTIQRIEGPKYSPDLNTIGNIFDEIGRSTQDRPMSLFIY